MLLIGVALGTGCDGGVATDSSPPISTPREPLRMMAVGDSITHGVPRPSPSASWRLPFTAQLDDTGCSYEMVGSQTSNALHATFESPHEAYSEQEANHFITGHTNWAGTNDGIQASMASYTPDLVLLHIGTNDVIQGHDNNDTVGEIDQIITSALDGGADVLVANLIPTYANAYLENVDERIAALTTLIDAHVAQLANPRVHLVNVRGGYTQDMMFDDGVHPNQQGSEHIADAFYNVLETNRYCEVE